MPSVVRAQGPLITTFARVLAGLQTRLNPAKNFQLCKKPLNTFIQIFDHILVN